MPQTMSKTLETPGRNWLNRTVLGVGITSALGDFAYETANVILPGFLAVLGIPAAALGAIEGIADSVASFTKLGAGYLSDRLGRRKTIVCLGYALTPLAQILFAIAGGWWLILLGRIIAWFGRGIRGPLRDAMLAEAITPTTRGRAFGFHRAADTVGAVIGPLLGVGLLAWSQRLPLADPSGPFRLVFWLTLIPGILSVFSYGLLVPERRRQPQPELRFWSAVRGLPGSFRQYLGAVGLFGIGDFAHTLLILAATQLLSPTMGVVRAAQVAGLLYVGRNVVQTLASYPVGVLADRLGHRRTLAVGYALGVLTAALVGAAFALGAGSLLILVLVFALAGVYVAVQDALEASMTADYVPLELRGIGFGVLGTVNGVGDLVSSTAVGALWTMISPAAGFGFAAVLMAAGTAAMALLPTAERGKSS